MTENTNKSKASETLGQSFTLPNGAVVKNRFMKSAMSEGLGTRVHAPKPGLTTLYGAFADGGTGLVITGNVMIDPAALGEPANVVVTDERDLEALRAWAAAGTRGDTQLWVQINHPGKQVPKMVSKQTVAPSPVPLRPPLDRMFATPRALTEAQIEDLIERFGNCATIFKKAGFTGAQIHGAHGYLVSQFLSPIHNVRTDKWGGAIENRMRFAREVFKAMRAACGPDFPIGIKLNSADFQRGGFSEDDFLTVVDALGEDGIDLLEISGGSYEEPTMTGVLKKQSTVEREAYFLEYAEKIRKRFNRPLGVTGGFRSARAMAAAVESGALDFVGLARPLAIDPELPNKILAGRDYESPIRMLGTGVKAIDNAAILETSWYQNQLHRIAAGKKPKPRLSEWRSLAETVVKGGWRNLRRQRA